MWMVQWESGTLLIAAGLITSCGMHCVYFWTLMHFIGLFLYLVYSSSMEIFNFAHTAIKCCIKRFFTGTYGERRIITFLVPTYTNVLLL